MKLTRDELEQRLRRAEALLREREEETRIAFELSGVGQVIADAETTRFLRVNQSFCVMMGYSEAELLELSAREISHPDDADIFSGTFYPKIQSGEISEYVTEKRYVHRRGDVVWVSINAMMLPDRARRPRRIAALIRDISAQKKAEQSAMQSATMFRAIFENSVDAIAVYEGYFHAMVNPAYVKLFGYSDAAELIGKPGPDLIAPAARERIKRRIAARLRGEIVPAAYVTRGLRRDGTEFDLDIHASYFEIDGGQFRLVILRDVTKKLLAEKILKKSRAELELRVAERTAELSRANARLQRASRHRKRLETELWAATDREQERIGADLHDGLGQQLAGIGYFVSAMEMRNPGASPRLAADLRHISAFLNNAVAQTREIARGLYPPELEKGLFVALEKFAENVARTHEIECNFSCAKKFAIKKSAANQLYRIAQEAVTNALRHGRATRITLELICARSRGRLVIRDNGSGKFDAIKKSHGLGLRTMRNRAGLLDGTLEIKSGSAGTVVTCLFPCAVMKKSRQTKSKSCKKGVAGESR